MDGFPVGSFLTGAGPHEPSAAASTAMILSPLGYGSYSNHPVEDQSADGRDDEYEHADDEGLR